MDISETIEKRKYGDRRQYRDAMRSLCEAAEGVPEKAGADSLLEQADVMSRRIHLTGRWWKNDAMPLLCQKKGEGKHYYLVPGRY